MTICLEVKILTIRNEWLINNIKYPEPRTIIYLLFPGENCEPGKGRRRVVCNYWLFWVHKKRKKEKKNFNRENPGELLLFHGFPSQCTTHCSSATQGNSVISLSEILAPILPFYGFLSCNKSMILLFYIWPI